MSIEELMCVVPPPKCVHESGDENQWELFQKRLGMEFPRDFYEFGRCYGRGRFEAFDLTVLNPFSPNCLAGIEQTRDEVLAARERGEEQDEDFPVYPDSPGHFHWGGDSSGYGFWWFTQGEPQDWPTVGTSVRGEDLGSYEMSMTTFLANAISGEIEEYQAFADDQKHIFSNDLGPASPQPDIDPHWLAWNNGIVLRLARSMHDDKAFDRMAILADALEEAGCHNEDILNHCRRDRVHLRGCWVLASLLEKSGRNKDSWLRRALGYFQRRKGGP